MAMPVLTETQIKEGYFDIIGGFPAGKSVVQELKDYKGEERLCIACTQLPSQIDTEIFGVKGYSEREKRIILDEWIDFLQTNTKTLKALHFNSHVSQKLFNAACCQENLEELRFKWGAYSDLSALENLKKLKFLYIGSGASVRDITVLGKLKTLVVLYIENFKRIEDYFPLTALDKVEQLVISGPTLGYTPIKDYEFLCEMENLLSAWFPNTTIRKKYTSKEFAELYARLPNLRFIYDGGL